MTVVHGSSSHEEQPLTCWLFCPEREGVMFFRAHLHTAENPLPLHSLAPIILTPTELAVVDFGSLIRIADLMRTAQHVVQHGLCIEFGPIFDGCGAKVMFLLESVDKNAANYVIREEKKNFNEIVECVQTRKKLRSATLNTTTHS